MSDETTNSQGQAASAPAAPAPAQDGAALATMSAPAHDEWRERLTKWFDRVAQDWGAARGKKAVAQVGAVIEAGKGPQPAPAPIAVNGTVKYTGTTLAISVTIGEDAALAITRMSPGSEAVTTLDDISMAIFGERIQGVFASLEGAWRAEVSPTVEIEVASPERAEKPVEPPAGSFIVPVVMSFDDNVSVPFSFIYGAGLDQVLAVPDEPVAAQPGVPAASATSGNLSPAQMARILKIKVPLRVEIARRRTTVKEVLAFKPGTVIEFEKNSEDLLDLCAGLERVAKGEAVKVGESFGMRVLEVSTVRDRIKSLSQ